LIFNLKDSEHVCWYFNAFRLRKLDPANEAFTDSKEVVDAELDKHGFVLLHAQQMNVILASDRVRNVREINDPVDIMELKLFFVGLTQNHHWELGLPLGVLLLGHLSADEDWHEVNHDVLVPKDCFKLVFGHLALHSLRSTDKIGQISAELAAINKVQDVGDLVHEAAQLEEEFAIRLI